MITFLKIVAGCIVAILLLIGVAFYFIRHFLRDCLLNDPSGTPLVIHLNEDIDPKWLNNSSAANIRTELISLGFKQGLSYTCPEIPELNTLSLFHGDYTALIYDTPDGNYCEIAFLGKDETEFTYSNQPYATLLEQRPGTKTVYLESATPTELYTQIKIECQEIQAIQLNDETFRGAVESSYKKDIIYTNANGGISRDQFQIIADRMNKKIKPEKLNEAFQEHKLAELQNWNDAANDQYFESLKDDEDESTWDFQYFIVPTVCDRLALLNYLSDYGVVDEEKVESLNDTFTDVDHGHDIFNRLNEGLSPDLRATSICPIEFPVEGKLYRIPY